MILFLDTTQSKTTVGLYNQEGKLIDQTEWISDKNQSEELLSRIDQFLIQNKTGKNKISQIIACPGPGSYTGIRVGLSTANALAFTLDISILAIKDKSRLDKMIEKISPKQSFTHPIVAKYQNLTKITKSKARP